MNANRSWRELVSEGRLVKAVATRGPDGQMTTEVVIQEGPVAFCESTTKSKLLDEDASRMLILNSDDSEEQNRRVVKKVFNDASKPQRGGCETLIAKHWAFQRLISSHPPVDPHDRRDRTGKIRPGDSPRPGQHDHRMVRLRGGDPPGGPNAPVQRRAAQRTVRCNRLLAGPACYSYGPRKRSPLKWMM